MAETYQSVIDWLTDGARSAQRVDLFMAETCERLVACGVPLYRVGVFVRTLHPSMLGRNFIWRPGEAVKIGAMAHGDETGEEFLLSPLYKVFYGGEEVRHCGGRHPRARQRGPRPAARTQPHARHASAD